MIRRIASCSALAMLSFVSSNANAADAAAAPREELIVASVSYNFARFIQWDAEKNASAPSSNFVFCILDPTASPAWGKLEGKAVGERKIQVEYLGSGSPSQRNCNMVYVNERAIGSLALGEIAEDGVVSISDARNFVKKGGAIQLSINDNGASFDINERSLSRAGARISSKLMRVGMRVSVSGK